MKDGDLLYQTAIIPPGLYANEYTPAEYPGKFGMWHIMVRSIREKNPERPKGPPVD
jgi:hypothetical protein